MFCLMSVYVRIYLFDSLFIWARMHFVCFLCGLLPVVTHSRINVVSGVSQRKFQQFVVQDGSHYFIPLNTYIS